MFCDYFGTPGTGKNPTGAVDYEALLTDFRSVSGRKWTRFSEVCYVKFYRSINFIYVLKFGNGQCETVWAMWNT